MRTTARTPLASSKARSAGEESTMMHSSVSSTADARDVGGGPLRFGGSSFVGVVMCRDTRKRSIRICRARA